MSFQDSRRRIVVTGAAGRIGRRLQARLGDATSYDIVSVDRDDRGEPGIHSADLSRYDTEWTDLFAGADTVIHLAGDPRPTAPWQSVAENNIEATLHVFRAASEHNVRRVIYASTLMTMEGHRFGSGPISADTQPRPTSFYAASKLMGESIGRQFSQVEGMSVICLRIGAVQVDRTSPSPDVNAWRRTKWLSGDDLCQAFEKAILADVQGFAILPLVSDNDGMRWDLTETRRVIGYKPTRPGSLRPIYMHVRIRGLLGHVYKRLFDPAWRDYWR